MRPGSAVRLRGTWHNAADRKQPSTEGSSVSDIPSQETQSAFDKAGMGQDGERTTTAQELQVVDVEILGASDPQVSRFQLILVDVDSALTVVTCEDLSNPEQVSNPGELALHFTSTVSNTPQFHSSPSEIRCYRRSHAILF